MAELAEVLAGIKALATESQTTRTLLENTADRLDKRIEALHNASMDTARELGGVQATLRSISSDTVKLEGRVLSVEKREAECPARSDIKGVNARIKKLETFKEKVQEERGETTGVVSVHPREFPQQPGLLAAGATVTMKDIIFKAVPFIVSAFLAGAAFVGFLLKEWISK